MLVPRLSTCLSFLRVRHVIASHLSPNSCVPMISMESIDAIDRPENSFLVIKWWGTFLLLGRASLLLSKECMGGGIGGKCHASNSWFGVGIFRNLYIT